MFRHASQNMGVVMLNRLAVGLLVGVTTAEIIGMQIVDEVWIFNAVELL